MSTGTVHRGAYLLYINGLEVPCPSVSVSCQVGGIPEARFALAPHPSLQRLGADDRVEVAVFYLDDALNPSEPDWRVLFEGEILGWSYQSSPTGIQMSFTALADLSIFQRLEYSFMTATDVVATATSPTAGVNSVHQPGAYYPFSLFKKGLLYGVDQKTEEKTPDVERPFEILFNAVRGMMDVRLHEKADGTPVAVPLVNFFARWARKRNFQNRFAALPIFEDAGKSLKNVFPILDAIQSDYAFKSVADGLAGAGDQGTMWDVLQQVFTTMYFELATLPAAPAYRVRLAVGYVMGPAGQADVGTPTAELLKHPMRLRNYFVKPQTLFAIPPTCNVFLPSMVKGLSYQENYAAQPTRSYVNESLIAGVVKDGIAASTLVFGFPEVVNAAIRNKLSGDGSDPTERSAQVREAMASGRNVLVYPEEFFKGPVVSRSAVPSWFTILMTKSATNKVSAPAASSLATAESAPTQSESANVSTAAQVSSVGTPTVLETQTSEPDIHTLFDTYVRYEYYRARYEQRGGSVSLAWNPYVVPGFPCVVFDRRAAPFDLVGYVQGVTWNLGTSGLSTEVSFGYGRTVQEFLQTQFEESERFGFLGAGPAEMLPSVRDIVQRPAAAEEFYRGLFYGRSTFMRGDLNKPASATLQDLVGHLGDDGEVRSLALGTDGSSIKAPASLARDAFDRPDFNIEVGPLHAMEDAFHDEEAARQFNARPICTLAEYVRFRTGAYPSNPPDQTDKGAPYYARLYSLRQGPAAAPPTPSMTGASVETPSSPGENGKATAYTAAKEAVPRDFPQTRVNWDAILEAYVQKLKQLPPLT